ncbi:MAG: hypothetical protein JHC93_03210 [Parachlamydiales bacterium]|nr:hypothetical protein [Parachlamydiales bacterium]
MVKFNQLSAFDIAVKKKASPHFSLYLINVKDEMEGKTIAQETLKQWNLPVKRYHADQMTDAQLKEELSFISLFDERRVVLIERLEKLKKNNLTLLEKETFSPSVIFILCATSLKNEALNQRAEKEGMLLDLSSEKPWERQDRFLHWIHQMANSLQKKITDEAARKLLQQVGFQPPLLKNELDKLSCFVGQCPQITLNDLMQVCVQMALEPSWHWTNAILQKKAPLACHLGRSQLEAGGSIQGMLVQLRTQFQTSYRLVCLVKEGRNFQDLQREFPQIRGEKALQQAVYLAEGYGMASLRKGIVSISEIDLLSRSSISDPYLLMDLLIARLL